MARVKNWKKRAVICKTQISANERFGNAPIGGVRVKDKIGKEMYLNQHPKTDWNKQLVMAQSMLRKN